MNPRQHFVILADRQRIPTKGSGTIEVPINGKRTTINDVLYVPNLRFSLLSIARLTDKGIDCLFSLDSIKLARNRTLLATGKRFAYIYLI